jgi:hypothetical protein
MKIIPAGVDNAIGSLEKNRYFPLNPQGGAISKLRLPAGKHTLSSADSLHTANSRNSLLDRVNKSRERERSLSISSKRKAAESDRASKLIRLEEKGKTLHDSIQNSKVIIDEIANDIYAATANSDPAILAILSKIQAGMSSHNDIMGSILSEQEVIKIMIAESGEKQLNHVIITEPPSTANPVINIGDSSEYPSISIRSRKPLNQAPLGGEAWSKVVGKKSQKTRKAEAAASHQVNPASAEAADTEGRVNDQRSSFPPPPTESPFTITVREAERSVVIFNLDLGQAPLINPVTISTKVTAALVQQISKHEHVESAKVIVDDILSMVRTMDCLGTSTRPCKDPKNPSRDNSFYTIPVKLVFYNKPTAKKVTDILRRKYKLNTTIPYHKSLKACITLAYKKLEQENPGYQVKINLDTVNQCLRGSIRKPVADCPETEKWIHTGKQIALPPEAMDTKLRNIPPSLSLPTSPTKSQREAGNETHDETNSGRQEPPTESWSEQMETQDWVQSQNLASQSAALFSGRSSLTMRTPPLSLNRKNRGSVGSVHKSPSPSPLP